MTDIYLYPPAVPSADIILSYGLRTGKVKPDVYYPRAKRPRPVIVAKSMYRAMVERYGRVDGERIYFAMQAEQKGPFGPGAKYEDATRPDPVAAVPRAKRN